MKKIYLLVMIMLIGLALPLSACGNPYKDMELEILTGEKVEIYLTENVDVELEEGELVPNTAEVKAKVNGVSKKVSKDINFVSGDTDRLQVVEVNNKDGVVTALLRGLRPGVVNLEVITKEGGKHQMVTVFIYRNVTEIAFSENYQPAVIADGQPHKIDSTKLEFTPADANIRDVKYSLVSQVNGATIDAEGNLTVTNGDLGSVKVRVEPLVREDQEVFTEIDVIILPNVDASQISYIGQFNGQPEQLTNQVKWVRNNPNNSLFTVTFGYFDLKVLDSLRIRAIIEDTTKIAEKESAKTDKSVTLSPMELGYLKVFYEVYYNGYEDLVVATKELEINIVDAVTTINTNVSAMTIFNTSTTSSYRGEELVVELLPKTISNTKYKLEIEQEFKDNLYITNATGGNPFDANGEINSGTKIYFRHNGEISNTNFTINVVPVGDTLCESAVINIECLTSVETITTKTESILLGYSQEYGIYPTELEYSILPTGAKKETVQVISNNENVVVVVWDDNKQTHYVVPRGIGFATISFNVNGRTLKNVSVEVVAPFSSFLVDIDAPSVNPNVSGKTMVDAKDKDGNTFGRTLSSAVIKVGTNIKVKVNPYPFNSKLNMKDITYTIEEIEGNANLASIDQRTGILKCESNIKKFKLIIEVSGFTYSDNGDGQIVESEKITKEVVFTSIMPIESIAMNRSSVQIYDINTVGIDEITQAQTKLYVNVTPRNATINSKDVEWEVSPKDSGFEKMLDVQSDGSVIVTGNLGLDSQGTRTFIVRAVVKEYQKVYSVECLVKVVGAKTVEHILLEDYDEARGVYLKGSDVNDNFDGDNYQIKATAMPVDAKNTHFKYFAYDINPKDSNNIVDGWYFNESNYKTSQATRISVSETGLITTKKGQSGYAVVWIVPADNIRTEPFNKSEIKVKRVVLVYVADGSIENPFEIHNYTELTKIAQAPDKAYRLVQTLDFANITNYVPIGTQDKPFTGTFSGKYILSSGQIIINGITNFKLNANANSSAYYGLFGVLGENANISDIILTIANDSLVTNVEEDQKVGFGYVTGLNKGTITNVTVRFNGNLEISSNLGTTYVGGIVGINEGTIKQSRSITYSNFGLKLNSANSKVYLGGLAGVNNKDILGNFEYVGDNTLESSTPFNYNVDFNDENLNSSITIVANNENALLGGIVARNSGKIENIYSNANLENISNLGGISAENSGEIFSARFTGYLKGNNNVGGIVGTNEQSGSVVFGIVEICDDKVHFSNLTNENITNFGGVIGNNAGLIKYSYINSYSAQRLNDNENVDISLNATLVTFGAFVGYNVGSITKSFANIQLDVNSLKIFFGENVGTISLCYSLSYLGSYVNTIQTFYNASASDETNFIKKSGINFGLPMILINKEDYSQNGEVLLTQSPQSLSVTVYGELNKSNNGKDNSTNRYYKYSDKQLVLLLNNSQVKSELNKNYYDLSQMFDITINPASERNKTIIVEVVVGQDIVRVEGSTLITLKEGYAKLRFSSDLDYAIFDEIEIFVAKGITSLDVNNITPRIEEGQIYRELKLQLGKSFNYEIANINKSTTQDGESNYDSLQSGGYVFTFETADVVEFDKATKINEYTYQVRYADSQIITALKSATTSAVISPYIEATFFANGTEEKCIITLSDIKYEYSLIVYRGLQDMQLQSNAEEIMPNTTLNYSVTLKTDINDSVIDTLRIYQGETTENVDNYEEYNIGLNLFSKEVSTDSKFKLGIIDVDFDSDKNEKVITFEIIPSKAINGELAILEKENYIIEYYAKLGNGQTIKKQFKLTLNPQSLTTILANHYNDGNDFDSNLTNAGEEISTKIIPGQYGLLIINVWPEYSVFDRLEIVSSRASSDVITFEQVYYNIDSNNYDTKVDNVQLINNGISLKRQSTKHYDADNDKYIYEFDGRIFLRTLTGSNVQTGQVFTITINAYSEGQSTPYLSNSLELTALQAPYLEFDFQSGKSYKGIKHEYYAAEQTNFVFKMTTDAVIYENDIKSVVKDSDGNIITAKLTKSGETVVYNSRKTINYVISASGEFKKGKTYYVEMVVSRNVNGITTKTKIVNKLHIVDFIVKDFKILDGEGKLLVSKGLLSRPLATDGWFVYIKLDTIASENTKNNIVSSIERQLNGMDTINGEYFNPWKYMVLSGTSVGQFETIDSENVSNNFVLTNEKDGTGYKLIGKTIANIDTLMVDFEYFYNELGQFTLGNNNLSLDGNPSMQFRLDFSLSSSQDNPLPIYNKNEFLAMEEGLDYILLNDIDLGENYEPLSTKINSLDGNGYMISVSSISVPLNATNNVNLGLFSEVSQNTLLKNINLTNNDGFPTLNLTSYQTINFGLLAGVNNGIITNANVNYIDSSGKKSNELKIVLQNSSQESVTTATIGGLVGTNAGIITNSRVQNLNLESSGMIGGFVGINNNTVSSSYVLNPSIQSTNGYVGGFVAVNNGYVNTSYIRGLYSETNTESLRAEKGILNAVGQVGGFAYQNASEINDCYANIKITSQSRSAGFVYDNVNNGKIYNCLSLSDIIQNSIAHMPFIGTDSSDRFLNKGTLENAYFYQNEDDKFVAYDISGKENPAQKMSGEDLKLTSSLSGFAFSDFGSEFSGVWVQPNISNNYFNASSSFGIENFEKLKFRIGLPELVAPNVIAHSVRRIDKVLTNENGVSIYNYVYVTQSNALDGEKLGSDYGSIYNQAIINDVDDFVYNYEKYQNEKLIETSKVNSRLINNINFGLLGKVLNTPKVTLSGIIEGNGLSMYNISVVSDVDEKYDEFGLFKRITGSEGKLSALKNLSLSFIEVKSSSSTIVGSIAGRIHNANLIDIEVLGNNVAVKGANIVGGVVGLVTGDSTLYKINTNISANSSFRNSGNETLIFKVGDETKLTVENAQRILYVNDSLFYDKDVELYNLDETPLKDTSNYVSYAGAVAGVVETMHQDNIMQCYLTPNIYDIKVNGSSKVIGATAGGVFGMLGLYTFASNIEYIISKSNVISGDDIAGGIVGELRGKLSQSQIIHTSQDSINNLSYGQTNDNINLNLFKSTTTTKSSGGLVGLNLGGTILDCISYAYVRNTYSNYAGGAVGVTISGDIKSVIATGSVLGRTSVGGLIGGVIATNDTGADIFYNYNLLPLYYNNAFNIDNKLFFDKVENTDGTITYDQNSMVLSYVMAGNNWTTADQEVLNLIQNWGGMIGYFDTRLSRTYIHTTHPQDDKSNVNLINFYVAGGTNKEQLKTRGNEDKADLSNSGWTDWMHIAEPITFSSLTLENKDKFFGAYYRFVWNNDTDSKYPEINIKAVPETIEIANTEDLLQIVWNLSANYLLVDDIDLSSVDSWLPLGTEVEPFSGTLKSSIKVNDGTIATRNTYYEIKNLKIVASNVQYVGLFGVTGFNYNTQKGAEFENLVITVEQLVGSDFSTIESYVGALVADARGAKITNVVVTPASKNAIIVSSSDYTGGIVGRMSNLLSDIDIDDNDESKGKYVIKGYIKDSLSTINIGVLNRTTNANSGEISQVGGVIGHLRSGVIENTVSNQKIGLAESITDGLTGEISYQLLDMDKDYNVDYYNQSLYIGGLIGSNSSHYIDAGGNTEGGNQKLEVKNSLSNTNIDIAKLNLVQIGDNKIVTYIGGFAGVLNKHIKVTSSISTGTITTNGNNIIDTATNKAVIGGFAGKVELDYAESNDNIISKSYSLSTLIDQSTLATIKGFALIGYQDQDVTNNSNAPLVANDCYYEHYYAMVEDYDESFGVSSNDLKDKYAEFDEFTIKNDIYYPVLLNANNNDFVIGFNDRPKDFVVYGVSTGTKLNPIQIKDENSLINVAQNANNKDEYLYYLVTQNVGSISTHIENAQGEIVSNNSPMINEFKGFLNGNGFFVSGFTIKESPKTFDAELNVIEETSGTENTGFVRILKKGSYISGLSLREVSIDYQSSTKINDGAINVAGLVGLMEKGSGIFASTVSGDIFVKGAQYKAIKLGVESTISRNQTLNIGGIVGYNYGGSIINSANYARVASYDYLDYKGLIGSTNNSLNIINAGGIAGRLDNGAILQSVFSISELNFTKNNNIYANKLNLGTIAGLAQYSTIKNWYGKVDLVEKEFSRATILEEGVGYKVVAGNGASTNVIEDEKVQTLSKNSDLSLNYGYEYAPLLVGGVPKTQADILNNDGDETKYYVAGNSETLHFLLQNNYNIALNKDIYVTDIESVENYSGQINGQFNAIYGIDKELVLNVNGSENAYARIENLAISGQDSYTGNDKYAFTTLGSMTKVSMIDMNTTKNTLSLSKNKNEGILLSDINSNTERNILNENKWINLSPNDAETGERIRAFVEYWDAVDMRGVYLEEITAKRTVLVKNDEGKDTLTQVDEERYNINDAYQLAKYAKHINDGDSLDIKVTQLNHNSTFDLSGKIWNPLNYFKDSLVSSSENVSEKPKIINLYAEGRNDVGFISTFNSAEGRLFNIEFNTAKIVPYDKDGLENPNYSNFGVVAGQVISGQVDNVTVSGIININAPSANYVGTMFGKSKALMTNIKTQGDIDDINQSKIIGLDFVGGIAGSVELAGLAIKNIDANYNILGRDFVGGYFGYGEGYQVPTLYNFEVITEGTTQIINHKNSGNIIGRNFVGGIVGYNNALTLNCVTNEGNIYASGYAVGGIAGYTSSQILSATNGKSDKTSVVQYNDLIENEQDAQSSLAETLTTSFVETALAQNGLSYSNTTLKGGYFVGGLVGYLDETDIRSAGVPESEDEVQNGAGNISNPRQNINYATISAISFVGGIVGFNDDGKIYADNIYLENIEDMSTIGIKNCNSVEGITFVGGIVGLNYSSGEGFGIIKDAITTISQLDDNIVGKYCVGGTAGANFGYIWAVATIGNMSGQTTNFGGIAGYNEGDIEYANSSMIITLIANDSAMSTTSDITCNKVGQNYYVGGIAGHNVGTIKHSAYTKGNGVGVVENAGQITFMTDSSVDEFYLPKIYIAGICGVNEGLINESYVDNQTSINKEYYQNQTLNGNIYIGGLVAKNNANCTISNSYSLAKIYSIENLDLQGATNAVELSQSGDFAGGLVHINDGEITSCYARYSIFLEGNGTVSNDCYVMNVVAKTITNEIDNGDGTTTTETQTINQLEVDSNYKSQFGNFINNKFLLKTVEFTNIGINMVESQFGIKELKGIQYEKASVKVILESKDGTFADTNQLINNYKLAFDDDLIDLYNTFSCQCGSSCQCGDYCCTECQCTNQLSIIRVWDCVHTHQKLWLNNFHSSNSYYTYIRNNIFTNVIFNLAYTGVNTPTNSEIVDEELVKNTPSKTPSTGFLGEGTSSNPYRIYSVNDIETINTQLEFGNTYYGVWFKLMNNIDASNVDGGITIGTTETPFQGTLDGNNKAIINNKLNGIDNIGLFPTLGQTAQVLNLNLVDCTSEGENNVGLLVGSNRGNIENISIISTSNDSASQVKGKENVGGIVGLNQNSGNLEKCSVGANVEGTKNVGGVVGYNQSGDVLLCETVTITYDLNNNSITGTFNVKGKENVGGIVGYSDGFGSISKTTNEITVEAENGYGGGIVGYSVAESVNDNQYAVEDVVNRGNIFGNLSGQVAGKLESKASRILALATLEKLLGEGNVNTYLENYHTLNDIEDKEIYQINAFKVEMYKNFDFDNTWGMSATQLNVDTNQYSHPVMVSKDLTDNYPRIIGLKSSERLNEGNSFFTNQYFNVNDVKSVDPTIYIESKYQFDILMNYFLGRFAVSSIDENKSQLLYKVKNHYQYLYNHATYKLYKDALDLLDSNMVYENTVSYSNWTALPLLSNRSIDFNGITIKIDAMTNNYKIGNEYDKGVSAFMYALNGSAGINSEGKPTLSKDFIKNLNLEIKSIESGYMVAPLLGELQNGTISNCHIKYFGTNQIVYSGPYVNISTAGVLIANIQEPKGDADLREVGGDEIGNYAHGRIDNCSSDMSELLFVDFKFINNHSNNY